MLQLNPAETFPIVRQLTDHTDSTTYYVRAVIKNATNETVLATVDLEDKTGRYFRYNWKVVWDNTMARGRFISITTSVYTDSGYTTKSENYGDEIETYLVQERWDAAKMQSMGGGGSYSGLTATDVRKVIRTELDKLKFPEQKDVKFPKQKEYGANFNDVAKGLGDVKKVIKEIPTVNLKPIVSRLEEAIDEIQSKPITPETNLKPLLRAISDAQKERAGNKQEVTKLLDVLERKLTTIITKIVEDAVQKTIPNIIQKNMEGAQFSLPLNLSSRQNEKADKISKIKSKFGL